MANYVLYHANCLDGLGAAYSAWKRLGAKDTQYIQVQYDSDFPDIALKQGDTVVVLDFSFRLEVMQRHVPQECTLVMIDHHEKAKVHFDDIMQARGTSLTFGRFDTSKSGAVLAWEFYHTGKPVPLLLQLIQDRDLWKFEIPSTQAVIAGLRATAKHTNFEFFDPLVFSPDGSENIEALKRLALKGDVLLARDAQECETYARPGSNKVAAVQFMGYKTALYNTTTLISDIGAAVLRSGQGYDVSMSYFVTSDLKMVFSLRSYDKGSNVDVGDLARRLGGGGHRNASGFTLSLSDGSALVEMLVKDNGSAVLVENQTTGEFTVFRTPTREKQVASD